MEKKPTIINLQIQDCQDCPFCKEERMYTEDSWEHAYDYFCEKNDHRQIASYVEWRSEMPEVPDWCPCRPENFENALEEEAKKAERISKYTKVEALQHGAAVFIVNDRGQINEMDGPFIYTHGNLVNRNGNRLLASEYHGRYTRKAKQDAVTEAQLKTFWEIEQEAARESL